MRPKEVVKCYGCSDDLRRKILSDLLSIFQHDVTTLLKPYDKILICSGLFSEVYLVSDPLLKAVQTLWKVGRNPYCVGIYVGRLRGRKQHLIPSTMLAYAVFSKLGTYTNSVVVSDDGLKPFLYGRDVLKASVIKVYPKLMPNHYTFIVGTDGQLYGFGISATDEEGLKRLKDDEVVVKNVFDVGWYLRGGTKPREKKFKI